MATLGGKSIRTIVTSLEVLSDDGKHVLMLDQASSDGGVRIRVRKTHDSKWGYDHPTFTVSKQDAEIVTKIVGSSDAQYIAERLRSIDSTDFTAPAPIDPDEVERKIEERCSQLDIERAKAANMEEEKALLTKRLIVQHMDDKHIRESVVGCPKCDSAAERAFSRVLPVEGAGDDRDLPNNDVDEDGLPF